MHERPIFDPEIWGFGSVGSVVCWALLGGRAAVIVTSWPLSRISSLTVRETEIDLLIGVDRHTDSALLWHTWALRWSPGAPPTSRCQSKGTHSLEMIWRLIQDVQCAGLNPYFHFLCRCRSACSLAVIVYPHSNVSLKTDTDITQARLVLQQVVGQRVHVGLAAPLAYCVCGGWSFCFIAVGGIGSVSFVAVGRGGWDWVECSVSHKVRDRGTLAVLGVGHVIHGMKLHPTLTYVFQVL